MFDHVWGNELHKGMLRHNLQRGGAIHAYILEGPAGSGKHTLASAYAEEMVPPEGGDGLDCAQARRKIRENLSPDVILYGLQGEKKTIGVDTVRRLREEAYLVPNELPFRMLILEHAERMTAEAQNALLKILEEPPAGVHILLLCENAASLLVTVRSRAPVLHMQRFTEQELDLALADHKKIKLLRSRDPQAYRRILRLADGCIGKVLENAAAAKRNSGEDATVLDLLEKLGQRGRDSAALTIEITQLAASDRSTLTSLWERMLLALRDCLLLREQCFSVGKKTAWQDSDLSLLFFAEEDQARALAQPFTTAALLEMEQTVRQSLDTLAANGNLRLTMTRLAAELRRSALK